jgi:hypothetical protein
LVSRKKYPQVYANTEGEGGKNAELWRHSPLMSQISMEKKKLQTFSWYALTPSSTELHELNPDCKKKNPFPN